MDPKILDGILTCPGCGGQHLHHVLVDVFARHQEDSETGLHVVVGSVDLIVDQQMTDNPSPRRGVSLFNSRVRTAKLRRCCTSSSTRARRCCGSCRRTDPSERGTRPAGRMCPGPARDLAERC